LEDDRIEREVREQRKRQGRAAVFATPVQAIDRAEEEKVAFNEVLVSIRLLHGGLIKARFLEGKGLAELRKWVDEVCFASSVVVMRRAGVDFLQCVESNGWGGGVHLHATARSEVLRAGREQKPKGVEVTEAHEFGACSS